MKLFDYNKIKYILSFFLIILLTANCGISVLEIINKEIPITDFKKYFEEKGGFITIQIKTAKCYASKKSTDINCVLLKIIPKKWPRIIKKNKNIISSALYRHYVIIKDTNTHVKEIRGYIYEANQEYLIITPFKEYIGSYYNCIVDFQLTCYDKVSIGSEIFTETYSDTISN